MSRTFHYGAQFDAADTFGVLVREAVYQHAQQQGIDTRLLDSGVPVINLTESAFHNFKRVNDYHA